MTGEIQIRLAGPDDASALAGVAARTFSDSFAAHNTPQDVADYLARWFTPGQMATELSDPQCTFLVAEVAAEARAEMVGYAKLRLRQAPACVSAARPIEIHRLYVLDAWHGKGVGPALMQACLDRARLAGHDSVWLGVWDRNPRARAFYRKCGFIDVGEHPFQFGSDLQTDIVMQIRL